MSRRDDLISTARSMFRERGYQATGIDAILTESGAAKATLYSLFGSKDALTLAALEAEGREFRERLDAALNGLASPADRVLAVFDFAGRWFRSEEFNGCMFVNAAVEFPDRSSAIRELVAAHKQAIRERMRVELGQMDVENPDAVAGQLQLLFEGAIVMAQVTGDPSTASTAREAAVRLIEAPQPLPASRKAETLVRSLMRSDDGL